MDFLLLDQPVTSKNGVQGKFRAKKQQGSNGSFTASIGNKLINPSLQLDNEIIQEISKHEEQGQTSLLFSVEDELALIIYLDNSANLRPESKNVVSYLQKDLGKEVYILSGDSSETVNRIGRFLEIPSGRLFGNVDAQSKKALLTRLKQNENKDVMMIGDGLNDVLSIQEAAVGVSINSKSELNIMVSDVVALNENLWKIVSLFNLSRNTRIFIWINLFWAFAYNIFVIPIAAGVLSEVGIIIPPFFSSLAMSASSLIVVLTSNLLKFIPFDPSKRKRFEENNYGNIKDFKSRLIEEEKKNQENGNYVIEITRNVNNQEKSGLQEKLLGDY